ncbi:MAG: VWA domain-containing protein, partial [Gemmataceae bacterium]
RPRLFSPRHVAGPDRSVQAALLFDTSPSMEYNSGGVTRLDEARNRARELLGDLKSDSRVAVIDAGEERGDAFQSIAEARTRLESLKIRPGVGSLNLAVERALRLLQKQETSEEGQPRVLYVFTDRTRPSWDPGGSKPVVPEGLTVLVVDVGLDEPKDLGISKVQVQPALVAPGARLEIRAEAGGTAQEIENQVSCQVDGENRLPDRRPFRLAKGQNSETLLFEREAPAPPASSLSEHAFQVTLLLGTRDALPFNNARHATFHVRQGRKLLTLVDRVDAQRTRIWEAAHAATRSFDCEVRTFEQAEKITDRDLASYPVVVLFEVERVPDSWWKRLATYVKAGGGLAVVPGGDEAQAQLKFFNDQGLSSGLLPAAYATLSAAPVGKSVPFERFAGNHPLMAPFVAWSRGVDPDFDRDDLRPFVRRYWKLGKLEKDSLAIARYADAEKSPALAERSVGKGKVVAFTTPLDFRFVDERRSIQWNNFWTDSSFGLVLIDRV